MRGAVGAPWISRRPMSWRAAASQAGDAVATFRIATTEKWKNKDGEKKERTEWHNITFFGRLAEVIEQYVHKGDPIYIEGKLQTDKWQDKDGNDRYTTKIIGQSMQMMGSKQDGEQSERPARRRPEPAQQEPLDDDGFDSDIPF